jgi:hypothetical protein
MTGIVIKEPNLDMLLHSHTGKCLLYPYNFSINYCYGKLAQYFVNDRGKLEPRTGKNLRKLE